MRFAADARSCEWRSTQSSVLSTQYSVEHRLDPRPDHDVAERCLEARHRLACALLLDARGGGEAVARRGDVAAADVRERREAVRGSEAVERRGAEAVEVRVAEQVRVPEGDHQRVVS